MSATETQIEPSLDALLAARQELLTAAIQKRASAEQDESDAAVLWNIICRIRTGTAVNAYGAATNSASLSYATATVELLTHHGKPLTLGEILDGVQARGVVVCGETRQRKINNLSSRLSKDARIGVAGTRRRGLIAWPGVQRRKRRSRGESAAPEHQPEPSLEPETT